MGELQIMVAGHRDDVEAFWKAVSKLDFFEYIGPSTQGEEAILGFAKRCLELKKEAE